MVEKVKVGKRGRVVISKKTRRRISVEHGTILEVEESEKGLLLKPHNPVSEMKGLGKGIFGEPVECQRKLRQEWEPKVEDRPRH